MNPAVEQNPNISDIVNNISDIVDPHEEEDLPGSMPADGEVFEPGDHLIELELARPSSPDMITKGLLAMGITPESPEPKWTEIILDQSAPPKRTAVELKTPAGRACQIHDDCREHPELGVACLGRQFWDHWREWGVAADPVGEERGEVRPRERISDGEHTSRFRFVGRLDNPIYIRQHPQIQWIYAHRLKLDPWADLKLKLLTFALETGKTYEIRFLSRMRAQPTRAAVCEDLAVMQWRPLKLSALKKDMRIPGRAGASVTLWLGVARWEGPMSYITAEDPFYFEDVVVL